MIDSAKDNTELIGQIIDAYNRHDTATLLTLFHDDADIFPTPWFAPSGTSYHGTDGVRSLLSDTFTRFERIRLDPREIRELGAWTFVRHVVSFTGPDGRDALRDASWLYAIDGGRIRSAHGFPTPEAALEAASALGAAPTLTPREREVFRLLALGFNGPEIAEQLVLSPATVRTHVHNGIVRLGARTRAQAIALALTRHDITL